MQTQIPLLRGTSLCRTSRLYRSSSIIGGSSGYNHSGHSLTFARGSSFKLSASPWGPWHTTRSSKPTLGQRVFSRPSNASLQSPDHNTAGLPNYEPPRSGFLSLLPTAMIPYGELMRLDKPAGTNYLFFPCLFSTLLAASYLHPPSFPILKTIVLFYSGALIMRGAGCTINDLWDRDFDPHVTRTRLRPIARKAVTPFQGLTFFGVQCLAGLAVLLQFPTPCLFYGIPSLLLVITYPLAKRITHYPQFVLGLTFSWGAVMGFPALGVNLIHDTIAAKAAAALYGSCVSWTVLYDMIYAHMDIKDDAKVGIKSIALRHEKETKALLSGLAVVQVALLYIAGATIGAGPVFALSSCGGAAASLALMIWKVNLKQVSSCWWWFRNGGLFTGGMISFGLLAEILFGQHHAESDQEEVSRGQVTQL